MNKNIKNILTIFSFVAAVKTEAQTKQSSISVKTPQQPNIIFILADDMGVGDVGVFFQNQLRDAGNGKKPYQLTPYLDKMAAGGAIMEQYCPAPVCAPSRASLLLGQSQGHANVRDNQFDKALADNYTLGNVMQLLGYSTAAIGKWGLQGNEKNEKNEELTDWPAHPLKRGFDYYFGYIRHKDGHEHYPKEGVYGKPKEVYENYKEISSGLDKCYTGDLFTAVAKKYIVNHQSGREKEKPFFLYLAYDIPHAVLELPTQAYPKGFGVSGGLQWKGVPGEMINTASGVVDSWMDSLYANKMYNNDNDAATPDVPWPETFKRYATVNSRIDNMVEDILVLLKDLGISENTMVVFTSDNGPSQESYLPKGYAANNPSFFSSFGPYDGIKRDLLEGGIREPTIAYWPGHIAAGKKVSTPSIFYDWMPTMTAAAGFAAPAVSDGVSLLPELLDKGEQEKSNIYIEYFEQGKTPGFSAFDSSHRNRRRNQMQMLRFGDTVCLRYNIKTNNDDFEIYDVRKDPKQTNNLARTLGMEALQLKLKATVLQSRLADPSAPRPYDSAYIPAINLKFPVAGWSAASYNSPQQWLSTAHVNAESKQILQTNLKMAVTKENSFCYTGYLKVPADGKYTFRMQANGKAFLRLHNIALIDEDYGYKSNTVKVQSVFLKKGFHEIKLFYKKSGNSVAQVKLDWNFEGKAYSDISKSIFSEK